MSVTDLTTGIVGGINAGGEQFLEGTLAAILPVIWILIIGLHISRGYILDLINRFTLRLAADLLWLVYIAARDFMILSGVVMSFMFFFPDVVLADNLPITGGLAAVSLMGVLVLKLMTDPDNNPMAYQLMSVLLGLGALFYFVPYVAGVQGNAVAAGNAATISNFLVTSTNPIWAVGMAYVSVALIALLGAVAVAYTLITGGRSAVPSKTAR